MKPPKISSFLFFAIVLLWLAVNGILLFALPQRTFSENENRCLTTFQTPTLQGFFDTSLQENLTRGADDQFIGRDLWMKTATALQRTIGFTDIGGVYFGKDNYYFERLLDSRLSESRYVNNLRCLEQFAADYPADTYFLPVPPKAGILKTLLPAHAVTFDDNKLYAQAKTVLKQAALLDIRPDLSAAAKDRPLYFKTDHHWTMEGAYTAYNAFCTAQARISTPLEQFSPKCVSKDFFGTLYSKAPAFQAEPDVLVIPQKLPDASVYIDAQKAEGIYDPKKLKTKDKYGIYFGGNFGRIDIHMQESRKKKLLVIKDSFANSAIPFFMADYQDIILLDFRYYNAPISVLMQEEQPDETLVLYELSNFAQDMNFFKIRK